jgi:hypothetical protein
MTTIEEPVLLDPDERTFRAHLDGMPYQVGVDRRRWRLVSLDWPYAVIAVTAAERPNSPTEYFLRFGLDGYPEQAPTVAPWQPLPGTVLAADRRPQGEIVAHVFRHDWNGGQALYAPYDRTALSGHPDWPAAHPADAWKNSCDITFVLTRVWQLLNTDDYRGSAR